MMSVPLALIIVSKFAVTQFRTGIVAAMLATVYALIAEHVKVCYYRHHKVINDFNFRYQ